MDNSLYEMIFKRKSFHLFRNIGNEKISKEELNDIENKFNELKPLVDDIKVKIKMPIERFFLKASSCDFSEPIKNPTHKNTEAKPIEQDKIENKFLKMFFFKLLFKNKEIQFELYFCLHHFSLSILSILTSKVLPTIFPSFN